MRGLPIALALLLLLALADPAAASSSFSQGDARGDVVTSLHPTGAPAPSWVVRCDDPSVDIVGMDGGSSGMYGSIYATVHFAWLDGPRECMDAGQAVVRDYAVTFAPASGGVLPVDDVPRFRATRDANGWALCSQILFHDGTASACFGAGWRDGTRLSFSVPVMGWAPLPDGRLRAYTLHDDAYNVTAHARSHAAAAPASLGVEDTTSVAYMEA